MTEDLKKNAALEANELSDDALDAAAGGANAPELTVRTHTGQKPKQSSAPYGSTEWWNERRASMTPPPSENTP